MISNDAVARLKSARDWEAFERHLRDTIYSLDTVIGIKGTERAVAIEIRARELAMEKLSEILKPFAEFKKQPDTNKLAQETARDAGLDD